MTGPRDTASAGGKQKPGIAAWGLFLLFLIIFAGVWSWLGTKLIYETNRDPSRWEQRDFVDAVFQARRFEEQEESGSVGEGASISSAMTKSFPHFFNGKIDPLWPWLLNFSDESGPEAVFLQGKSFNVVLSGVVLILFGLVAGRAFSFLSAASFLFIGGMGFLLDHAVLCRSDALVFLLTFFVWVCLLSLIRHNVLWKYGMLGFLSGLLFLSDAFIWPPILAFGIVSIFRTDSANKKRPGKRCRTHFAVECPQSIGWIGHCSDGFCNRGRAQVEFFQ